MFGFDSTVQSPLLIAGVPFTGMDYARVVNSWYLDFTVRGFPDSGSSGPTVQTQRQVFRELVAANAALVESADSTRIIRSELVLPGPNAVRFWEHLRKIAVSMGSLNARVTADERWKAAGQGARKSVEVIKEAVRDTAGAVGQAAGEIGALAGEAAGRAAGGFLSGAGLDNVLLVGGGVVAARFAGVI